MPGIDGMLVMAHRGFSSKRPENTMTAFELAAARGADGIEMDARFTGDGRVIVLHDDSLDRTTNGRGHPEEHTLRAIRRLDAGAWFSRGFSGEKVPCLSEVLDRFGGRTLLNIEIKPGRRKGLERAIVGMIRRHGCAGGCIISSFLPTVLDRCRKLAPGLEMGLLWEDRDWKPGIELATRLGAGYFNPSLELADGKLAEAVRKAGLKSIVFTVNRPADARRLRGLGYHGIFTDDPCKMKEALG